MGEAKSARDEEFQTFVVASWPRLLRTAFLLAGEQYAAEDLVQSAAEKACAAWSKVRRADDPYAYVRRILVNQHARRWRRRPPELLVDAVPDTAGSEDGFARSDQRGALLAALATLPPRQREAVVLRYWEDLSDSQTATAMGCSVGAVRSHAAKGIGRLRQVSALGELKDRTEIGGAV
ncbi:SigE family RNA polymerase sigma factor [Kitasatospora aureofaciens]|uniref:DNA-directed RNA polymerase sigma-70 factor n=1 Tax=Kitasatospora aureofaciens TaxID=1894 RepID=A0A1E7N014_KITAU|nr:SigE family RNA polymerase sigma factor [Kitasatospora aureofaciens]QEU99077.1 SigE family RNA polymerase sigma factor [Streptomyces viridifaciens]ARF77886.1 SigE family RNA polymerase sigma factor [Kitasatospora aureofaciens]OEV34029.1 RNA polymerase subunit sigma-24 [Kitasatospora aureofaciens]UKZ05114.1 SigE family RNA polymerase sigma factor [Streptomyces viridifaciens]GGU73064.1 DNA-directed RNA polymerase sigma-70 factor [Kitasatospora aureofaciens]